MTDPQEQAQAYQALVLQYEDTNRAIQVLIAAYGGHTENMPPDAMQRYRDLAQQRDVLDNQIKAIQATWLNYPDDD